MDVGALLDVASRCDAVADVVEGIARDRLDRLTFGAGHAGRDYAERGEALRRAVDDVVDQMHVWGRAMREIAAALRVSGARYVDADVRGAARLG
ncbi:hypothetical protein TUM20985_46180 [Mycobacterium antarcticum]|uniref:type VII secretion target n=1 Tax=Mycolicibacterium sp. TUM20985 TaxID=3023370 RepID=UPI00238B79BB|nr:type VII secretion target [Mycolicibacterium sp. TUM20985]BDX34071.1 hypothetical protein TUM20985_46180 [Mycolicibacterium sp. TUM20985]GLP77257.1 hypothetical protein TUM20983_43670 [Mycolicibacterium sp. TUM20983]GLP82321.1 hypothetical protein TUM20984_37410 [Mycolicibacterium sp. TUM20984]